ncbi:hypothetical protein ACIGHN_01805 [Acidovorax sp. NPDC077693]|jgi:hypothetical protein|nr:hypothetical protein [Acidovorax sp. Leaf191]
MELFLGLWGGEAQYASARSARILRHDLVAVYGRQSTLAIAKHVW